MFVVGITGPYGSGKSTTGVVKAHQWAAASGAAIWANFPLAGAFMFDHYTDWYRVADLHGSIIVFDESYSNFDSRKWASQGQVEMTQVLNYVRKMNCLIIFILPDYDEVDNRIRKKTDIMIECQPRRKDGPIVNLVYDYRMKSFSEKGQLLTKWVLPKHSLQKIWDLKLFNTHSMITRFPTPPPNKVNEFFKTLDDRHNAALERIYGKQYIEIATLAKEDLTDYGANAGA